MRDNYQIAAALFERAEGMGLDAPSEDMVAEALLHHESNTLNWMLYELETNGMAPAAKHMENQLALIELKLQGEGGEP